MKDGALMGWIRRIVCCICAFQLFLHVLPGETYKKYVQFFGSLILLLLVAEPLVNLSGSMEPFEQELKLLGIRGEFEELEQSIAGMLELRSSLVTEAFQKELVRQMEEVAKAYGLEEVTVTAAFAEGEDGTPGISSVVIRGTGGAEAGEQAAEELSQVYGIPKSRIQVRVMAGTEG
ncbi:MAG: stage III sporulation protein AF [Eubacteriales bacterium]|nr:stage III sporulation protein AF [Eubacteriales bacterium]